MSDLKRGESVIGGVTEALVILMNENHALRGELESLKKSFDDLSERAMAVAFDKQDLRDERDQAWENLKKANANHEHFERLWYLVCMERDSLMAALRPFAEPHGMGDNYVKFAPRLIIAAREALRAVAPQDAPKGQE